MLAVLFVNVSRPPQKHRRYLEALLQYEPVARRGGAVDCGEDSQSEMWYISFAWELQFLIFLISGGPYFKVFLYLEAQIREYPLSGPPDKGCPLSGPPDKKVFLISTSR